MPELNNNKLSEKHLNILSQLKKITIEDQESYNKYLQLEDKKGWLYYFPYLLFLSESSKSQVYLYEFQDSMCVFYLGPKRLSLYFLPFPFSNEALNNATDILQNYNEETRSSILCIYDDELELINANKKLKISYKGINYDEYLYIPTKYDTLAGGKFRKLRQNLSKITARDDIQVRDYTRQDLPNCLALLEQWGEEQGATKYQSVSGHGYTKACLKMAHLFSPPELFGIVILVAGEIKSFGFSGAINSHYGNLFIGKSDHTITGLNYFLQFTIIKKMQNYKLLNHSDDGGSEGLRFAKRMLRPDMIYKIHKASLIKKNHHKHSEHQKKQLGEKEMSPISAARNNDIDKIQQYLDDGLDINEILDYNEQTLLHIAIRKGSTETALLLIERGANVNLRAKKKRSPLYYAVKYDQTGEIAKHLIIAGVDIEAYDSNGDIALITAMLNTNIKAITHLLNANCQTDEQDKHGMTALHFAINFNNIEIIELLLKAGANYEIQDDFGNTAKQLAENKSDKKSFNLIKQFINNSIPFSQSILWKKQKEYYQSLVIQDSWAKGVIPFFPTSNNFIATQYAYMIESIINDKLETIDKPINIIELGCGHGRFSYLLLKTLEELFKHKKVSQEQLPFRYIMTDISSKNINFWKHHPKMQKFIDNNILDFALFDITDPEGIVLDSGSSLDSSLSANSNIVISNFVTSALAYDIFKIKDNKLYECSAQYNKSIDSIPSEQFNDAIKQSKINFTLKEVNPDYYQNKEMNKILKSYLDEFENAAIDFPVDVIKTFDYFQHKSKDLYWFLSDEAYLSSKYFNNRNPGVYKLDTGSFSNTINLDALKQYIQTKNYKIISQQIPNVKFDTYLISHFDHYHSETSIPIHRAINGFNANDFKRTYAEQLSNDKLRSKEVLSLIKLSDYDAVNLTNFSSQLLSMSQSKHRFIIESAILYTTKCWNNYFDIGEDFDMGYSTGRIFRRLKQYEQAIECFNYTLSQNSKNYRAYYYIGLCYEGLNKYAEASDSYQHCLKLHSNYSKAQKRFKSCQKKL